MCERKFLSFCRLSFWILVNFTEFFKLLLLFLHFARRHWNLSFLSQTFLNHRQITRKRSCALEVTCETEAMFVSTIGTRRKKLSREPSSFHVPSCFAERKTLRFTRSDRWRKTTTCWLHKSEPTAIECTTLWYQLRKFVLLNGGNRLKWVLRIVQELQHVSFAARQESKSLPSGFNCTKRRS